MRKTPLRKKSKNKGRTYWRKKGSEEAKRQCRTERPYCEMCGKTNCKIEAHHLLTESAFPQMSNQKENLIVLCVHCHKFGKESFHGTPKLMLERFEAKFPGRYEFLFKKAQTRSYVDYEGEYKQLKQTEK